MKPNKLHKIAPILSEISLKDSPFQIPKNYFDTIEDGVMAEIYAERLDHKFSKEHFKVPEGYFSENEDALNYLKKTTHELGKSTNKKSKVIEFNKRIIGLISGFSIAASIALFFFLRNSAIETITIDTIATSEIEQSINAGLIDVNQVTLAIAFPNIDISTNDAILPISDSELEDYLGNENIESFMYDN